MIGNKDNFISFNEIKNENNVTFGNNSSAFIKGKGNILLKEKAKARMLCLLMD